MMGAILYWILPVLSGISWALTLFVLFIYWLAKCRPRYASMDPTQSIPYISDVGATSLKAFFITGCCLTTVFHILTLVSEIWLRYTGRLTKNTSLGQRVLVWFSLLFATNGSAGLILLSVFDTLRYHRLHNTFLALFIAGFILSAIFTCWEYQRLGMHFREQPILRFSFWLKLIFILISLGLVVAFATQGLRREFNTAAILEWVIALFFSLYLFSFVIDLFLGLKPERRKSDGSSAPLETDMHREMIMS
ncbi:Protein sfk1 [Erysiphe neolycopersici]|uniref:Protein sfk1 n=1 Tax=Erysiphe neolycopersici TaxID=212602 RepID=A0A420HYL1_9PEZI|nr:Protein sfk1 [Erysiphe neolycopersici]